MIPHQALAKNKRYFVLCGSNRQLRKGLKRLNGAEPPEELFLRMDHALPTLERSSRSLPGSGEFPEHACTTEGKRRTGTRQRFQAHALRLHLALPLQHHDEVGVRLAPGTALACWRGAAALLEDAARQSCGGGMKRVEGMCQGLLSYTHRSRSLPLCPL